MNALREKLTAMVISSFLTGLGGAFYAFYLLSLQPNSVFGIPLSVDIIIRPIVGGSGTLLGPILGSFILSPLAELSRHYLGQGGWAGGHLIAYGLLLILVVLFLPQGAYPALRRLMGAAAVADPAPLLEVGGLAKRFGGLQAVRALSFTVREGEIVSLIGPNGAGKTTVFALLSGFHVPDAGTIRLRGRSLAGLKPHAICGLGLARTFQIVRPFPRLDVLTNVEVGALAREPRRRQAQARARAVLDRWGWGRR